MTETWDRIHDAALQRHKDGGAELARLVISAEDEMRVLSGRVAELEHKLDEANRACREVEAQREKFRREAREAGMDDAAERILAYLAKFLGVDVIRMADGSEEWDDDVFGTIGNILIDADVVDDEDWRIARLRDVDEARERVAAVVEEAAKTAFTAATSQASAQHRKVIAAHIRALARHEETDALAERDARIRKEAYRDGWTNGAYGVAPPDFSDAIDVLNPQEDKT